MVGELISLRSIASIQEAFISEGIFHINVKAMGVKLVALTFPFIEEIEDMLKGSDKSRLSNWFVELTKWSSDDCYPASRVVWLNAYGVQLHLWNATFFNIWKLWGDIISLDDSTSNRLRFSVGKIKISIELLEIRNQVIYLESKGKSYSVKAIEEQVVIPSIMNENYHCLVSVRRRLGRKI